jgi:hypothetical protein
MIKMINEKVKVLAQFGKDSSEITPSQFEWDNQAFTVRNAQKAIYKNGGQVVYMFSGTDGATSFELDFNPKDYSWILTKIWNTALA